MSAVVDGGKLLALMFAVAVLQVSIFASVSAGGGTPDLLLVTLVVVALLRGPLVGATAGFFGGLVADVALLETLGLTSLVLTVAGYWIGRYGETTGRDRAHAPLLSVLVVTILYAVGALVLHFVIGDRVSAGHALGGTLLATIVFNLVLAVPVYAACRRFLGRPDPADRIREVHLLG